MANTDPAPLTDAKRESGFIISLTLVLVLTVVGIGIIVGLSAVRDAWFKKKVVQESINIYVVHDNQSGDNTILGKAIDFDEHEAPLIPFVDYNPDIDMDGTGDGFNYRTLIGVRDDRLTTRERVYYTDLECGLNVAPATDVEACVFVPSSETVLSNHANVFGALYDYADSNPLTDWACAGGACILNTTAAEYQQGIASIETVTAIPALTVIRSNNHAPVDSGVTEAYGYLDLWLYIDDVSGISTGQIEITSANTANTDEYNWDVTTLGLIDGWNDLHLKISEATPIGTPDLTAIDFFRVHLANVDVTMRVDHIRFSRDIDSVRHVSYQLATQANGQGHLTYAVGRGSPGAVGGLPGYLYRQTENDCPATLGNTSEILSSWYSQAIDLRLSVIPGEPCFAEDFTEVIGMEFNAIVPECRTNTANGMTGNCAPLPSSGELYFCNATEPVVDWVGDLLEPENDLTGTYMTGCPCPYAPDPLDPMGSVQWLGQATGTRFTSIGSCCPPGRFNGGSCISFLDTIETLDNTPDSGIFKEATQVLTEMGGPNVFQPFNGDTFFINSPINPDFQSTTTPLSNESGVNGDASGPGAILPNN
jgi:hypothetical protein